VGVRGDDKGDGSDCWPEEGLFLLLMLTAVPELVPFCRLQCL
jgi:hypothetical protein